jgi:Ala-tRNA(Pro) deacylase
MTMQGENDLSDEAISKSTQNIHRQLCALLDREGAAYRVLEHVAEGRTEFITQIRGNRIEQAIKSMVVQVRMSKKENLYFLANVPGDCRVDFDAIKVHFSADSIGMAPREKAEILTGCVIGSIPPFSFNSRLGVLADPRIQENKEVVFNAGSLEKSIFMKMEDYFRIANPQVVKIALPG